MKRIHLLRFEGDPADLSGLIEALREDDAQAGWLDLSLTDPVPPALAGPASLGVLRAVAVGPQLAMTVKPMRGEPVVRDLLREHFRGCRAVFVAGRIEAPILTADGAGWRVGETAFSTGELVAALRRPRPFK